MTLKDVAGFDLREEQLKESVVSFPQDGQGYISTCKIVLVEAIKMQFVQLIQDQGN